MPDAPILILTRPQAQSEAFAAAVADRLPGRFRVLVAPLIEIVAVPGALELAGVEGLAFTSANGVEQFAAQSAERGLVAYCVGAMTAAAARSAGFVARSADGDVADLAAMLIAAHRAGGPGFLHVRGRHAAGDLVGRLRAAGVPARGAAIYDQIERPLPEAARDLLGRGEAAVLAFFSPRSAKLFARAAGAAAWELSRATAVSISAAADAGLEPLGFGVRLIAPAPSRDGMLDALGGIGGGLRRGDGGV